MQKELKFELKNGDILITIPSSVIKFGAENNPETPLKVNDEKLLAEKVLFEIENNLGSPESGLTGFEQLLDEAIIAVAENGDECIDFVDDDE